VSPKLANIGLQPAAGSIASLPRLKLGAAASHSEIQVTDDKEVPETAVPQKRRNRLPLAVVFSTGALVLSVASAIGTYFIWRGLKSAIDEVGWSALVSEDSASANRVLPDVGTIQFLKNNFSIEFEAARYDANGLTLEGFIGNPTNLYVSNLTLAFQVKRPVYSAHDKFVSSPVGSFERLFISVEDIGSGQTRTIASLAPGSRERFQVAIPNVKQDKDGIDLRVAFAGERYSYLR
jgi:hypothetical protein